MNQILISNFQPNIKKTNTPTHTSTPKRNNRKWFITLLIFSILLLLCSLTYLAYSFYTNQKSSYQNLHNSYDISKLYATTTPTIPLQEETIFTIIGIIKIDKLKLTYPILSETTDELLKIAPCKFSGPNLNETGNLCIAGHNYDDSRFFSNLSKLNQGDEIQIFNSNGKMLPYVVFDKYETSNTDISCTLPTANNLKEITLITCNNFNRKQTNNKSKKYYLVLITISSSFALTLAVTPCLKTPSKIASASLSSK